LLEPIRDFLVDNCIYPSVVKGLLIDTTPWQTSMANNQNKIDIAFDVNKLRSSPRKMRKSLDDTILIESNT